MSEIKVKRANKILRIDERNKKAYLALGYNVIDAKGRVIEHNTATVTPAEYKALVEENAQLKAEIKTLKGKKPSAE